MKTTTRVLRHAGAAYVLICSVSVSPVTQVWLAQTDVDVGERLGVDRRAGHFNLWHAAGRGFHTLNGDTNMARHFRVTPSSL